jgi:hypothetical protein
MTREEKWRAKGGHEIARVLCVVALEDVKGGLNEAVLFPPRYATQLSATALGIRLWAASSAEQGTILSETIFLSNRKFSLNTQTGILHVLVVLTCHCK